MFVCAAEPSENSVETLRGVSFHGRVEQRGERVKKKHASQGRGTRRTI